MKGVGAGNVHGTLVGGQQGEEVFGGGVGRVVLLQPVAHGTQGVLRHDGEELGEEPHDQLHVLGEGQGVGGAGGGVTEIKY